MLAGAGRGIRTRTSSTSVLTPLLAPCSRQWSQIGHVVRQPTRIAISPDRREQRGRGGITALRDATLERDALLLWEAGKSTELGNSLGEARSLRTKTGQPLSVVIKLACEFSAKRRGEFGRS
jgi:hypothetical protein